MHNIVVLGAGMVGSAMAIDLAQKHRVKVTDRSSEVLLKLREGHPELSIEVLDVTQKDDLVKCIEPADLVVSAVPGFLGFETLKTIDITQDFPWDPRLDRFQDDIYVPLSPSPYINILEEKTSKNRDDYIISIKKQVPEAGARGSHFADAIRKKKASIKSIPWFS